MVIDGLPAGERIDTERLQQFMERRSARVNPYATARHEEDVPQILSGMVNGTTCGAPLCLSIANRDVRSSDYPEDVLIPRPSHADYAAHLRYHGFEDRRGGGHFSGRLTAPLCAAGGIAVQILERWGVTVTSKIVRIGEAAGDGFTEEMLSQIARAHAHKDSVGGIIECTATGVPAGWGNPMFDSLEGTLAKLLFGIPAVKGVEFGSGFALGSLTGNRANDAFYLDGDTVRTRTNHCGGINGGISNGMPVTLRVVIKPTPSIGTEQESVDMDHKTAATLALQGRHDCCIVPRAAVCVEAAVALGLLDSKLSL